MTARNAAPDDVDVPRPRPGALLLAGVLLGLEALAVAAVGVGTVLAAGGDTVVFGLGSGLFLLLYAAGLGWFGFGIATVQIWARAPVALTQLVQLGVAYSFAGEQTIAGLGVSTGTVAGILAVAAGATLICVFLPTSTRALLASERSHI